MSQLDPILDSLRVCLKDHHHKQFDDFVYQFRPVMEWVVENNDEPHINPASYHNTRHLIGVAFLTDMLSKGCGPLVQAAFIHDFRYQNASKDAENIVRSLDQATERGYFELYDTPAEIVQWIRNAVWATEYDFGNPFPEVLIDRHRFLRDADQLYGTVFFDAVVYQGLEVEVGSKVNVKGPKFLARNAEYVANNRFYTTQAYGIYEQYLTQCLVEHVRCSQFYVN